MDWMLLPLRRYAEFTGRSRRQEYWMFFLFVLLVTIGLSIIEGIFGLRIGEAGILSGLFSLAILIPAIAVGIRRLHDIDRSGWWLLIGLIPFVGAIVMIVFMATRGTTGDNRFGSDPIANSPLPA